MAGTYSNDAEQDGLALLFGLGGSTATTTVEIKLSTTTVSPDGTGLTEPGGTWYGAKDVAFGNATGNKPRTISNTAEIDYGNSDEDVSLVGWILYDKANGRTRGVYNFPAPISVQTGNPIKFAVGSLVVTLN